MYGISGDLPNIFGDFLAIYPKTSEIRRKETRSVVDLYLFRFQYFISTLVLFFKQIKSEAGFHNLFSQPNHINHPIRYLGGRFCLFFPHIFPTRKFVSPLIFITFVKLNHLFTSLIVYGTTVKIIRL